MIKKHKHTWSNPFDLDKYQYCTDIDCTAVLRKFDNSISNDVFNSLKNLKI